MKRIFNPSISFSREAYRKLLEAKASGKAIERDVENSPAFKAGREIAYDKTGK